MEQQFRLGEFFCGAGGLALGAFSSFVGEGDTQWRCTHSWANDYDPAACATYRKNICPSSPESVICADVHGLSIADLPAIDAFAYGFPCNDLKNARRIALDKPAYTITASGRL